MKFRFSTILALAAAGVVFSAASAQAGIVVGLNQIQYSDRETLATYNAGTQTYTAVAPGTAPAVGDHLYGILASTVESPDAAPPNATGLFDLVIAKIITTAAGTQLLLTTDSATVAGQTGGLLTGTGTFTLADGSTFTGVGAAADTLVSVYQGSTLTTASPPGSNLDTLPSQGAGLAAATSGTFFGAFGLGSALNDSSPLSAFGSQANGYWSADISAITGAVKFVFGLLPTATPPGQSYVPLYNTLVGTQFLGDGTGADGTSIVNNAGITPLIPSPVIANPTSFALVGGGTASVNSLPSPWPTTSADPFWIDPKAPEPGTMLMMGLGVAFGVPYLRRRRKVEA